MRNPLAAWRGGTRWPLVLIALLLALIVAIGICEAIGWPFLAGPLQNATAKALHRKVVLGLSEDDHSGTRIQLLGSVRVRATAFEIGSPSWSEAPHMLQARDMYLKLGYRDLWRVYKGQPLHVKALEAVQLDANLQRKKDGRASWQFADPNAQPLPDDAEKKPAGALPTFDSLQVGSGHVAYHDEVTPADIDANFALRDSSDSSKIASALSSQTAASAAASAAGKSPVSAASASAGVKVAAAEAAKADGKSLKAPPVELAEGETGLRLKAVGHYQKLALRVDLATTGALSLLDQGSAAQAQPIQLKASVGKTDLTFDGTTTDLLHLTALSGKFSGGGPSLSAVGDALGVTLPTTPSFKINGTLEKTGNVWSAQVAHADIGQSRLSGDFRYDKGRKVPLLSGTLKGSKLVLSDLGPAIGRESAGESAGTKPKTKGRGKVIPDKPFDLPSLRAMDADVKVDIAEFDTGTDVLATLKPMRAHILLADSVLTLADINANAAKGQLIGSLQLDGRTGQANWDANVGLRGVDLAHWIQLKRKDKAPPYLSGKLDARVDVKGSGRSTAEILGNLNGNVKAHMRDAAISHLAVEAAGIDVAQALGILVKGDESLRIQCNVIDLEVKQGLVKPRLLVFNTNDSTLWLDGIVSLKSEAMGLKLMVAPKDFSPLTLRTPVHIDGTLSDPAVSIEASKLAGKAGAAALLALVQPLAAVLPFIDTGSQDEAKQAGAQCAALVKKNGAIAAPPSQPKNTPVPAADNKRVQPGRTAAAR